MRRIVLEGNDLTLFDHEIQDSDIDYLHTHKETFKQMWQDQGKKFWIRFLISFRWYTTNHGVLAEFPGEKEVFDAIIDRAFIYIHEVFIEGKESEALNLLFDVYSLTGCRAAMKHLEAKTISKDPFYAKDTRMIFRRLFGDPSNRKSYINVYFTLPLYVKFGGALIECLKRWLDAPSTDPEDETYWKPPQNTYKPSPGPQVSEQHKMEKKRKKRMDRESGTEAFNKGRLHQEYRSPAGVDEDYELYLEEKMRGDPYGPTLMAEWVFGDPRFVDPKNPLYNTKADPLSDWRDELTFSEYRAFYDYVAGRYICDNPFPKEYRVYHPDVMTYPPPQHRRMYDEIERSFIERCEKQYGNGVHVQKERLGLDDVQAKDSFEVGKLNADGSFSYLETKKLPNPFPNVFPSLEPNTRLMIVRRHIDQSGPFCDLASEDILSVSSQETKESFDLNGEAGQASMSTEQNSAEIGAKENGEFQAASTQTETHSKSQRKRSKKTARKPKEAQHSDMAEESMTRSSEAHADTTKTRADGEGDKPKAPMGPLTPAAAAAAAAAAKESSEDSVITDTSEDEAYWRRPLKGRGPDYPTCMEEMKIVPMSDIDPTVAGLLQLMAMQVGDINIFHFARRKATLPQPDCRDEFTYGHVSGYTERQTLDTMAVTIQKEWRNARRRRKREKRARAEKKRLIREEVERRRTERRKERAEREAAIIQKGECKKAELMKPKTGKEEGTHSLRCCTTCGDVEPEPHAYKKCQRCQQEKIPHPRYYCSRDCQVVDWRQRHRKEHNEELL